MEITNKDKIFFPKAKISKGDLADYYQSVADYILPYINNHPHSLLRHPNGISGESFFQKDVTSPPKGIKTTKIHSESTDEDVHYLVVSGADSLLYMVQLGCIEINPWNSTIKHLDKPDWLVIDLDPEDIDFSKVVEAALVVKQVCDELGIPAYPKTSGKTGIHIYIPTRAKYSYDQSKQFTQLLANSINQRAPDFTSVVRLPEKRQKKVYIDFLQNRQGQTLAAPYSVRPTPEASVSTPLHWDEVNSRLNPEKFTLKNMQKRLDSVGDLWKPVLKNGFDMKRALAKLEAV